MNWHRSHCAVAVHKPYESDGARAVARPRRAGVWA